MTTFGDDSMPVFRGLGGSGEPRKPGFAEIRNGVLVRPPLAVLTTLRFFAAAEVVVFHFFNPGPRPANFFLGLVSGGYQAVTFFFVLSGFILVYVYSGQKEGDPINVMTVEFWRARIARILPAYYFALALSFPLLIYNTFIAKSLSIVLFGLGLVLVPSFLQAWWPPAASIWNLPAWSLSVECLFYALFPILMFASAYLHRICLLVGSYGLILVVEILRSAIALPEILEPGSWYNFIMYFPLFHLPQFIFGMGLGRLYLYGPMISPRAHTSILCVGIIGVVLIFGFGWLLPPWLQDNPVLVLFFALMIYGGARAGRAARILAFPMLVLLGEASYSIYILQSPVGFWWNWVTHKVIGLKPWAVADCAMVFALLILISLLCYFYIERPMRRKILGHSAHRAA